MNCQRLHCLIWVLPLLVVTTYSFSAQTNAPPPFSVIVEPAVGPAFSTVEGVFHPQNSSYTPFGLNGALRVLWHPDHLLSLGFETGHFRISTITLSGNDTLPGPRETDISLRTVPLLLVFSMRKYGIDVNAGLGYYYYYVSAQNAITKTGSNDWELGFMFSAGYTVRLNDRLGIGGELKYYRITDRYVGTLSPTLKLSYRLLEY